MGSLIPSIFLGLGVVANPPSLMVVPLVTHGSGLSEAKEVLSNALVVEMGRVRGAHVTGMREVEALMAQEQLRQVANCDAESCALQIAGALDVDQIVFGSVAALGQEWVLTLSRLNARTSSVEARAMARVPAGQPEKFLDLMPAIVAQLFPTTSQPPPAARALPRSSPSPSPSSSPMAPPRPRAREKAAGPALYAARALVIPAWGITGACGVLTCLSICGSGAALAGGVALSLWGYGNFIYALTQANTRGGLAQLTSATLVFVGSLLVALAIELASIVVGGGTTLVLASLTGGLGILSVATTTAAVTGQELDL